MIDYHSHILPGVDDGAKDTAEAVAMAAILYEAGFRQVHCTPHSMAGAYEAEPESIRRAVEALQSALAAARIPLRLLAGAEYYADEFLCSRLEDPLPLGTSKLVLMEAPLQTTPALLSSAAYEVARRGFVPLIAHPERCTVLRTPEQTENGTPSLFGSLLRFANERLSAFNPHLKTGSEQTALPDLLRSMGCRFQGNLGSFAGIYGERVRRQAIRNLESGLYDCLGSDAHTARGLADWLPRAVREVEKLAGAEALGGLISPACAPCREPLLSAACR